ncbi:hypothetical protein SARC_06296 [Sphaeroforma arctica JP610]|uniref:Uncharacterized protein n=1 Tax=Sphaeroforma arctica JP610 TaxID=667725 RepID=A0A0L0FXT1_9EUKA|nr:hypothetical protein SARC_06296 [Sphaeroforma arctica JP610]KNC81371.1 hypothetical protein SARC_06296 [Sphaeroforma arctica JP610]|eukprot:XP_014155273.1 hypothetical protein SARC_06296 [Sphaeroforma arctica JP610]
MRYSWCGLMRGNYNQAKAVRECFSRLTQSYTAMRTTGAAQISADRGYGDKALWEAIANMGLGALLIMHSTMWKGFPGIGRSTVTSIQTSLYSTTSQVPSKRETTTPCDVLRFACDIYPNVNGFKNVYVAVKKPRPKADIPMITGTLGQSLAKRSAAVRAFIMKDDGAQNNDGLLDDGNEMVNENDT